MFFICEVLSPESYLIQADVIFLGLINPVYRTRFQRHLIIRLQIDACAHNTYARCKTGMRTILAIKKAVQAPSLKEIVMQTIKEYIPTIIVDSTTNNAAMPENRRISEPANLREAVSSCTTRLLDTLRTNGPNRDRRQRRISLDRLGTKVSKRRQSLPILPSYLAMDSLKEHTKKTERKAVTFPKGILVQQVVTEGEVEELKELLHKQGNSMVEEREPNGLPPVMRAIFEDQTECLKVLLEAGADVTAQDPEEWNALHVASAMDNLEAANIILKAAGERKGMTQSRNVDGERPIDLAESVEMTRLLMEADLAEFRLDCSTTQDHVTYTEANEAEVLELVKQCFESQKSAISLDEVLKKNTCYFSLLHLVATKGYCRLADYVFTHWVPALETRNENGWTPLHSAIYYNNVDLALLLVDRGANIDAVTHALEKPADLTENELILAFLENPQIYRSIGSV